MFKEEKEIVTPEKIKKTLTAMHRAAVPMMIVFSVGGAILTALAAWILSDLNEHMISYIILWGAVLAACVLMTVWALILLVRAIVISLTAGGSFSVSEDVLIHMEEKRARHLYGGRGIFGIFASRSLVQVLHFQKYGTYLISGVDRSTYDYSSVDDRFYVVLTGKGKIALVYNQKVYEYKER